MLPFVWVNPKTRRNREEIKRRNRPGSRGFRFCSIIQDENHQVLFVYVYINESWVLWIEMFGLLVNCDSIVVQLETWSIFYWTPSSVKIFSWFEFSVLERETIRLWTKFYWHWFSFYLCWDWSLRWM